MKIELSTLEIKALSAAIAEETLKTLAPRLEALEKALFQRPFSLAEPKPQAMQGEAPKPLESAYLNLKELKVLTNLGETSIWRLGKQGDFPIKLKLSRGRVGWKRAEVMEWLETRKAA